MKNLTSKQKKILIIVLIILFIIGVGLGIFLGMSSNQNENNTDNNNNIEPTSENTINESQKSKKALTPEMEELKSKIEQDEAKYGNKYQKFEYCKNVYKRKPDRIYFKDPSKDGFFVFEKEEEDFEHLLEVTEDRMAYTTMEDYNLYAFTPDSINTMMKSKDTYIIFDYDNKNLTEGEAKYNKDIIFRFNQNTRLYRLVTYLSYFKELIPREKLGKEEFANNTNTTGFKYMMYGDFMD